MRTEQQRHRERQREQGIAPQAGGRIARCVRALSRIGDDRRPVSGGFDRAQQVTHTRRTGNELDRRGFGPEVDARLEHTGDCGQRVLDAGDARGAGHALHGQTPPLGGHLVAGHLHRGAQRGRVEPVAFDSGRFSRQVDGHLPHAGHAGKRLFDVAHATGARHSLHRQHHAVCALGGGRTAFSGCSVAVHGEVVSSVFDRIPRDHDRGRFGQHGFRRGGLLDGHPEGRLRSQVRSQPSTWRRPGPQPRIR